MISGINSGANVGINVIYSGTVAAAIEAAFLGLPSIALSLFLRKEIETDYQRAAMWSRRVIEQILEAGLQKGQCASVNLPAVPKGEQPKGTRVLRQCLEPWVDTYERRVDPRGKEYFWNSSIFTLGKTEADTDVAALRDRYITITPLQFDLTAHAVLKQWQSKSWDAGA